MSLEYINGVTYYVVYIYIWSSLLPTYSNLSSTYRFVIINVLCESTDYKIKWVITRSIWQPFAKFKKTTWQYTSC